MTISEERVAPADLHDQVRNLLGGMELRPQGQVSPSVYETARVVSHAPWLNGQAGRIGYLLATQRPDGAWGAPGGYALVPTISATEALFATLHDIAAGRQPGERRAEIARAVDRGLTALAHLVATPALAMPDLPAADLIVPVLTERINHHLAELGARPLAELAARCGGEPLPLPQAMTDRRLVMVRQMVASGQPLPQKLVHALEILGEQARGFAGVRPVGGAIGAAPAASAAWLRGPQDNSVVVQYLATAGRASDGAVPCTTPISVFERSWVLASLVRAGVPLEVPSTLVTSLVQSLGATGAATSPGLPDDADTTSVTLYALARLGYPVAPESLWHYDVGGYFCTWRGEDGSSITTNAHALEMLCWWSRHAGRDDARWATAAESVTGWLLAQQCADGQWDDRWHASPYYATSSAAVALAGYGSGTDVAPAVDRAVEWMLRTQRADGSWGRWDGTAEETAYALHLLCVADPARHPGIDAAIAGGAEFLDRVDLDAEQPALWHDKDLYHPTAIVQAAVLAARHVCATRSRLSAESR